MPLAAAAAAEHESHRTARITAGRLRQIERTRRIAAGFLPDVFVDRRLVLDVAGPAAIGRSSRSSPRQKVESPLSSRIYLVRHHASCTVLVAIAGAWD